MEPSSRSGTHKKCVSSTMTFLIVIARNTIVKMMTPAVIINPLLLQHLGSMTIMMIAIAPINVVASAGVVKGSDS